jgi:glycosidase
MRDARGRATVATTVRRALSLLPLLLLGCGDPGDQADDPYGKPPTDTFDAGDWDGGGYYGDGGTTPPADTKPTCEDAAKRCAVEFTYKDATASSVEVRGDYRDDGWTKGDPMTKSGDTWKVSIPVPYNKAVQYKLVINGTNWITDPGNPDTITDSTGNTNSLKKPTTCTDFTCAEPDVPPPGVYDWRDSVIYFVFVDRFLDGDATNNGSSIAGVDAEGQYKGGDWAGVTKKINEGYFGDLGVNTLWLTVPVQNADEYAGLGVGGDTHKYSSYHGYWPLDVNQPEKRFGTLAELKALVDAAHTKKIKILFDYAMVHVHKDAQVYKDNPTWFHGTGCICGSGSCPWETTGDRCWFTDYLPHWNYTNSAARDYSVGNAIKWIKDTGADGFRLDAIKHVDGSWLTQLRSRVNTEIVATTKQRFYMVGETYDFGNRDYLKSFVDPSTKLDGQFDFPLRLRLVQSVLMRQKPMNDLAAFMDSNDGFYGTSAIMSTWVGNHDLGRIIHLAEDTPLWSDPYSDGKDKAWSGRPGLPSSRNPFERVANAFAVLLTNKGAPLIYYGDEIGLPGAGDPDNRRMMQWTGYSADQTYLRDRIKKLLEIRAAHPALRRGKRTTLSVSNDLWVYSMSTTGDTVYVAINRGDTAQTATGLPASVNELITGTAGASIPPRQARIFVAK